jgi:hypothetical protein
MPHHRLEYDLIDNPEGEVLRAKIEKALGHRVTRVGEPSPVQITAEGDKLVVVVEHDADDLPPGHRKKIDAAFAAHKKR